MKRFITLLMPETPVPGTATRRGYSVYPAASRLAVLIGCCLTLVADVQSVLQEQGLYKGEVDGLVGPLTQEALAAYQTAQGLEPTAAIDRPTLESLGMG